MRLGRRVFCLYPHAFPLFLLPLDRLGSCFGDFGFPRGCSYGGVSKGGFRDEFLSFAGEIIDYFSTQVAQSQGEDFSRGSEVQSPCFPSSLRRITGALGGFTTGLPNANSLNDYLR
ncbi:hypothetical protein V6N12_046439 [Hibiscus sabdariffa]|uniref:Uncharacterized protein n=1 Tax=Hibiscus sabdariffa TaxID=183260 RepID=A0ABR2DIM5_9ROSI